MVAFFCDNQPTTLQYSDCLQKPHYQQQGRVCKAGTGNTVDVSSEERTSDLQVGESRDQLRDQVGESRDQLRGDDVRGRVLLSWPVG